MKRIVNFSGGVCSFWAAHRVVQQFGTKDVTLLFADVLIEDEELYQFNAQAEKVLGLPITRICVGLTPWELFRKQGMIANARFPICSVYLKREPLDLWHRQNAMEMDSVVYVGMDWTEYSRLEDLRHEKPEWRIEAPMTEEPLWDKCKMFAECEKLGMKIPRLYTLGFPHNNCGGRCVRAGISHWVHLLKVLPERFLEWEKEELETQQVLKERNISNWQFTILKDRRGGKTQAMTLRDLRLRVEAGENFRNDEWGGCGCSLGMKMEDNNGHIHSDQNQH